MKYILFFLIGCLTLGCRSNNQDDIQTSRTSKVDSVHFYLIKILFKNGSADTVKITNCCKLRLSNRGELINVTPYDQPNNTIANDVDDCKILKDSIYVVPE